MTKDEVVAKVAEDAALTKSEAENAVNALIGAVTEGLTSGPVELGDLGRFVPRAEAAHQGSNPQTHEPMEIPAQTRVLFHGSKKLREAVNAKPAA